jgi:acetyl esterase/lipase
MNGPKESRELWIRGVPFPELHVFRPARPDGSAMLVLPGGGYRFLSVQNEGLAAALRFAAEGTTGFVLAYRLPGEGWANRHLVPLQDAQRAMRLIRSRAAEFEIDPRRLGVLGFSAGGHLAADLAVSYAEQLYARVDSADDLPARPAYAGLIYPVTSLINPGPNSTSMAGLFGRTPPLPLLEARSPLLHVTKQVPPSFVAHAMDDATVPVRHSIRWAEAVNSNRVAAELHLFAEGGHGFGLHLPPGNSGSRWPDLFALWMRKHGG